jgi:hypothetical protein
MQHADLTPLPSDIASSLPGDLDPLNVGHSDFDSSLVDDMLLKQVGHVLCHLHFH